MLEQIEKGLALEGLAPGEVCLPFGRGDGPAVGPVYISSHHPSRIEQLSAPFSAAFSPDAPHASSGPRVVQPDVGALVEHPSDGDVVVVDEGERCPYLGTPGELCDAADVFLALVVGRVGLPREEELDGLVDREQEAPP